MQPIWKFGETLVNALYCRDASLRRKSIVCWQIGRVGTEVVEVLGGKENAQEVKISGSPYQSLKSRLHSLHLSLKTIKK